MEETQTHKHEETSHEARTNSQVGALQKAGANMGTT